MDESGVRFSLGPQMVALASSYTLIIWLIALIVWLIMTAVFLYHWQRYSVPGDRAVARARVVYLTLTIALLIGSGGVLFLL